MTVKISDIKLHLTQVQYCLLIALLRSIPRVLASAPAQITADDLVIAPQPKHEALPDSASGATVDLRPEVRPSSTSNSPSVWTTIDIFVTLDVVKLHLYDERASTEETIAQIAGCIPTRRSMPTQKRQTDRWMANAETHPHSATILRVGEERFGEEAAFQVPGWLDPSARK